MFAVIVKVLCLYLYIKVIKCMTVILCFRYLSVSALEEFFAGKDNVDEIKKAALDVCLHLTSFLVFINIFC